MTSTEAGQTLCEHFPGWLDGPTEFRGETTVVLNDASRIREVCQVVKEELGFNFLIDITSIDGAEDTPRWTLVYEFFSLAQRLHLRLKTQVGEEHGEVPTLSSLWPTADWHEREVYDMMGIRFIGHPDLRRILMWEGFPHYPLRKDFPVSGLPSDVPGVAFSDAAPLEGGPFVTLPGVQGAGKREPRARRERSRERD